MCVVMCTFCFLFFAMFVYGLFLCFPWLCVPGFDFCMFLFLGYGCCVVLVRLLLLMSVVPCLVASFCFFGTWKLMFACCVFCMLILLPIVYLCVIHGCALLGLTFVCLRFGDTVVMLSLRFCCFLCVIVLLCFVVFFWHVYVYVCLLCFLLFAIVVYCLF